MKDTNTVRISRKRLAAILRILLRNGVAFVQDVGPSNTALSIDEAVSFYFDPVEALRDRCDITRSDAELFVNERHSRYNLCPDDLPSL